MSNFGSSRLRLVTPFGPALERAQSAVGAASVLARAEEFASVADAVADCTLVVGTGSASRRNPAIPVVELPEAAVQVREHVAGNPAYSRVALVFGSEKRGLSNTELNFCQWILRIPTSAENDSMNLGQAVAVCLYAIACTNKPDAARAAKARPEAHEDARAETRASGAERERLQGLLQECLELSGYLTRDTGALVQSQNRQLIQSAELSSQQVEHLLGMLRKMLWKMKKVASES